MCFRGSANSNAKTSESKVRKLMALYMTGRWSIHRLAIKEGLSRTEVRDILTRRYWRHVPPPDGYVPPRPGRKSPRPPTAAGTTGHGTSPPATVACDGTARGR
jgi:hypothetical protein